MSTRICGRRCGLRHLLPLMLTIASASANAQDVYAVPDSVASDCSEDVTAQLASFVASVPDQSTIALGTDGCYRIDSILETTGRYGLTIEGNGATFQAFTEGDRVRRHLSFTRGGDLTIRNLIVRGANPYAGTGDLAYRADREAQHAFAFYGVQGALLEQVQAYDVYGDFVYISSTGSPRIDCTGIVVQQSNFERNGRQCITLISANDVTIRDNYIGDCRRSTFDFEPNSASQVIRNVRIENNVTGPGRLLWFASGGASYQISDVIVTGNMAAIPEGGRKPIGPVYIAAPATGRKGPFTFAGNSWMVAGPYSGGFFRLGRVIEVQIYGNQVLSDSRAPAAVNLIDAQCIDVTSNVFHSADVVFTADDLSSDYFEQDNDIH